MSIDADTFHASSQRHLSNLSTSTQVTVVDLSGDDSTKKTTKKQLLSRNHSSLPPRPPLFLKALRLLLRPSDEVQSQSPAQALLS